MKESIERMETAVWVGEDGISVEYAPDALDAIRGLAVNGLNSFGHGGLEVGGVLYGHRCGDRIAVVSFVEASCEHALSPGFVLCEKDRESFTGLLQPPSELETVGWYRSHTRGGLNLDRHDLEMFERYFNGTRSVGLTVKPTARGPAAAAFFVRDRSGEIRPIGAREFALAPLGAAAAHPENGGGAAAVEVETPAKMESEGPAAEPEAPELLTKEAVNDSVAPVVELELSAPPPASIASKEQQTRRSSAQWRMPSAYAAAVLALLFAGYRIWPRVPDRLALKAYGIAPGQVRIEWDHRSPAVLHGQRGILRIHDADTVQTITLDGHQLRSTSFTYAQHSSHISVRLQVDAERGTRTEESIDFIGPVATGPTPAPLSLPKEAQTPAVPVETADLLRVPVQPDRVAPTRVELEVPRIRQNRPADPPKKVLHLPVGTRAAAAQVPILVPAAPELPSGNTVPAAPPAFFPRVSQPKPPAPASASGYTGPASGRVIWTGVLRRGGVVEMDGGQVNVGSLNGILPGVPVALHVLPAEFQREGLRVFTTEGAKAGHVEFPGRANGWNRVQFEFDPVRAGELAVLEAPNRSNEFQRLVVRSDGRNCAVIVVEWSLLR